jgi:hypothetical protein
MIHTLTIALALAAVCGQAVSEKASRTPAQQKINSGLLYEIYRATGKTEAMRVPPDPAGVRIDARQRALVDVRAIVTPALEKKVRAEKGTIVSVSKQYDSIIAWVPLTAIERLARDRSVRAIEPAAEAINRKQP